MRLKPTPSSKHQVHVVAPDRDKLPTPASTPATPSAKESRPGGARSERPGPMSAHYDDPVETPTNSRAVPIAIAAVVLFALIAVAGGLVILPLIIALIAFIAVAAQVG